MAITAGTETQAGVSSGQHLALENGQNTVGDKEIMTKPQTSDTNRQGIQAHIPSDPNVRLNMIDSAGKKINEDGDFHHTLTLHSSQKNPHVASGQNLPGETDRRNHNYGNSFAQGD